MLTDAKIILFNFSSSYTGGGLKRLIAYLEWFDNNGGTLTRDILISHSLGNICIFS